MYTDSLIDRISIGLKNIVNRWDMPLNSNISLLTVSENATFLAYDETSNTKMILRVHAAGYHNYDEIKSELDWIIALREDNVLSTPAPIKTFKDELITVVNDGDKEHFVVAFEFMDGKEPKVNKDLCSWFEELGIITAKLHQHSKNWDRPTGFIRKNWSLENSIGPNGYWGDWKKAISIDSDGAEIISQAIEVISKRLEVYGMSPDRFGLVHADLRLANLLINKDSMNVIDFDDSGFSWYSYDFAAAISFHELDPTVPELKKSWIKGYRSIAEFSQKDEDEICTFIMLRRIMLTAWLESHNHSTENKELGAAFTDGTISLAIKYISKNNFKLLKERNYYEQSQ